MTASSRIVKTPMNISKDYGYKIISGIPYCVHEGWLYTIYVSNPHEWIRMVINVRPNTNYNSRTGRICIETGFYRC